MCLLKCETDPIQKMAPKAFLDRGLSPLVSDCISFHNLETERAFTFRFGVFTYFVGAECGKLHENSENSPKKYF